MTCAAALATIVVLLYELALVLAQRRNPLRLARSAHATLRQDWFAAISAQKGSGIEPVMMAMLFASLVSSAMVVRYYNHAGFIGGMPVDSDARQRWAGAGSL